MSLRSVMGMRKHRARREEKRKSLEPRETLPPLMSLKSQLCARDIIPQREERGGEQRNEIREEAGTPRRHAALSLHARSPLSPLSALLSLRPISEEP